MKTPATKTVSDDATKGLACPKCGCRHFAVVYTRPAPRAICRRRECRHCGFRILTREKLWGEEIPPPKSGPAL